MIATDTETTGLLNSTAADIQLQPYLTEIYCGKYDDETLELVDEYTTLVKPPVPIPDHIIKITGITNEMVANAPSFIQIYDHLVDFYLGERIATAHNIAFDMGVLWTELCRHELEFHFPWPPTWHCTVEKSFAIENKRLTLARLHEIVTGHAHQGAHRAKNDVEAQMRCYRWLREQGMI